MEKFGSFSNGWGSYSTLATHDDLRGRFFIVSLAALLEWWKLFSAMEFWKLGVLLINHLFPFNTLTLTQWVGNFKFEIGCSAPLYGVLTLEEKSCRISWCDLWKRFFFRVWESFSIFWFGWWYHSTRTKGLLAFLEECFEICHRWETFFRWSGSSLLGSRFNVSLLLIPYPPTSNRDAKSLFLDDKSAWKISLSRVETSTTSILLPSPFSAPLQYSTKLECVVLLLV